MPSPHLRTLVFICLIALLGGTVGGCSAIGEGDSPQDSRSGPYSFTAYDSTGTAIVEGTLNLSYPRDSGWDIEGTWEFGEMRGVEGPLEGIVGEGLVRGDLHEDGIVRISLRPRVEDIDTVLRGNFDGEGSLRGEWALTSWGTPYRSGRFEATPR